MFLRRFLERRRKKFEHAIVVNDREVALLDEDGKTLWRIQWGDVREVVAWKEDCYVVDRIYVGFRGGTEQSYFACHEEQAGWDELLVAMERELKLAPWDWWSKVAYPAFRKNWTVLWSAERGPTGGK